MQFLLIEDDVVDTEVFSRGFHCYLNYPLQVATNGDTALTLLRGNEKLAPLADPYIIILDLFLPGLHGLEFLHLLRQDPQLRHSVVFVLTSSLSEAHQRIAYNHCIAGYILKDNMLNASQNLFAFLATYCRLNTFSYNVNSTQAQSILPVNQCFTLVGS